MNFEDIIRYYKCINDLSRSIIHRPAFDELSVAFPDPTSPEPCFIRATSWLYCFYFEAGKTSLTFLRKMGEVFSLIERDAVSEHIEIVRSLRTELHHNLGYEESDQAARTKAQVWRRLACGTAIPNNDAQWRGCYELLFKDAANFLKSIEQIVRKIEADGDSSYQNIEEWKRRLDRSWSAAEFDSLVDDAKLRLGREALNTVAFRQRHVERWRKQLEILEDEFNFAYEATRLIEKSLLDENSIVLPITGREVMDAFNLKPGPAIGTLLERARKHYESTQCNKENLIEFLKSHVSDDLKQ